MGFSYFSFLFWYIEILLTPEKGIFCKKCPKNVRENLSTRALMSSVEESERSKIDKRLPIPVYKLYDLFRFYIKSQALLDL